MEKEGKGKVEGDGSRRGSSGKELKPRNQGSPKVIIVLPNKTRTRPRASWD